MNEELQELMETLNSLVQEKKYAELRAQFNDMAYADIAEFIMSLDDEKTLVTVFRILSKDISADVFSYLDADSQETIVRMITDKEIERLMDDLYVDDAVDFLEEVPANVVRRVLANTDKETREIINRFLEYPDNSAGSSMTIEMVELHDRLTVGEAIKSIRRTGVDKETIYTCYVIDDKRKLVGTIPLRRLILNDEDVPLTEIMSDEEQLIYVSTMDDQEEVASIAKKYDLLSVPVVDKEQRLVGIITIDDIVHGADHRGLRSEARDDRGTDRLYPDADGHRRQLREPGLYADHPRSRARRDPDPRLFQGALERDPRFGHGRRHARRCERRTDGAAAAHHGRRRVERRHFCRVSVRPCGRHGREGHRLYAADDREAVAARPGADGRSDDHDDRGRGLAADLFRLCQSLYSLECDPT